jgi:lactate dehydrogenase-like 2-hydroxyacid dehydrogenase
MPRPNVFVTRRIPEAALEPLLKECDAEIWPGQTPPPYEVLLEKVRGRDGIITLLTDRVDAALMDAAGPQLRVISQYAVGVDNIDVAAATERCIVVGHTPGVLTETTADLAFALLMAAARRLVEGMDYVRQGRWVTWDPVLLLGHVVHGASLGIVGMGRIGRAVARRAIGFDMRVLYYNRSPVDPGRVGPDARQVDLDTLLRESDFVSIHVPLTPETRHMIDASALSRMKPTAALINTARGPVVDTDALYHALKDRRIACAALDVTDPEPLPADHPLLTLPNVLVVPHIGSASVATRTRMGEMAVENLLSVLAGERPPNPVNPEIFDSERCR